MHKPNQIKSNQIKIMVSLRKILVVGATGATGKHVVQMLLDRGDTTVVALVRSKEKMMNLLNLDDDNNDEKNKSKNKKIDNLILEEAAIAELGTEKLQDLTKGCQAVISCLGHNPNFRSVFREGYFVSETTKRLGAAINSNDGSDDDDNNKGGKDGGCRFIVMGSDGITHPDGVTDSKRPYMERFVLFLLRKLLPPHADNEMTAAYLYQQQQQEQQEPSSSPSPSPSLDWCYVRPGDLIDDKQEKEDDNGDDNSDKKEKVCVNDNEEGYEVFDRPGSLFGGDNTARYDVAAFMTTLATVDQEIWKERYNHKMPAIYQKNKKNNE